MSDDPDTDELARRVAKIDDLIRELFTVLHTVVAWKDKMSGGMAVALWGFTGVQVILSAVLGYAVHSLNATADTLGQHSVDLATAKTRIENFMAQGPRFTVEMNELSEQRLKSELEAYVREQTKNQQHQ